jgi:phosphoribosyl-dephospho-CoA transferase
MAGEGSGVPAGLARAPFAGQNRLSFLLPPTDIVATTAPPVLDDVMPMAPAAWRHALGEVEAMASRHAIEARVFGSLAWQALTGLNLTDRSDLDLLLELRREWILRPGRGFGGDRNLRPDAIGRRADPTDSAAINWRELRTATGEILVRTLGGVALLDRSQFLRGKSIADDGAGPGGLRSPLPETGKAASLGSAIAAMAARASPARAGNLAQARAP